MTTSAPMPRIVASVISLADSGARRAAMRPNLDALPFPWRFFDALGGDAPSCLAVDSPRQEAYFGRALGYGEIGCFKSHYAVMRAFVEEGAADWLLVLEDDVWIDADFPFADFAALFGWNCIDYFRLFARRSKPADVLFATGQRQVIRYRSDPYGTQAYMINRAGAARFIAHAKTIDRPIDDELGRFWEHGLDPYAVYPFPAVERGASLIERDRTSSLNARKPRQHAPRLIHRLRGALGKQAYNMRFCLSSSRPTKPPLDRSGL